MYAGLYAPTQLHTLMLMILMMLMMLMMLIMLILMLLKLMQQPMWECTSSLVHANSILALSGTLCNTVSQHLLQIATNTTILHRVYK